MAEDKLNEEKLSSDAIQFVKSASTRNDNVREVPRSDYYKFAKESGGVPRELLDRVNNVNSAIIGGAITVAAEDLVTDIKDAKKDGNDYKDLKAEVVVRVPNGVMTAVVTAEKEVRVPGTDRTLIKHGTTSVRYHISNGVMKGPAELAAERVAAEFKK